MGKRMVILAERAGNGFGEPLIRDRSRRRLVLWGAFGLVCAAAFSAFLLVQGVGRQIDEVTISHMARLAGLADLLSVQMTDIGPALDKVIAEEEREMDRRNAEMSQTRLGLILALIAALVAAALLVLALLVRTQRQNDVLEAEIAARTSEIEAARAHAERERQRVETLLQDTNHRVGNSLATVSSLLALQVMRSRSDQVRDALEAARLRIHAIASAHRRLRLGDDMETASAQEFLSAVVEDIAASQPDPDRVVLNSDIDPIDVSARDATTLGILVGELVTNALKHGFPDDRRGMIDIRLSRDENGVPVLVVRDDGVGLSSDETEPDGGLGSLIIRQLAGQFDGEPQYERADAGGVQISIALPGLVRASPISLEL